MLQSNERIFRIHRVFPIIKSGSKAAYKHNLPPDSETI